MGRQASVTIEQVRAAVGALRAEGRRESSRAVREKLGNVGSMGTINKMLQQCLHEKENTPDSLRQLPPELQHVILLFGDHQADIARRQLAEELISCKKEMSELAQDNEQLATMIDDIKTELAGANTKRATIEGRVAQTVDELASAREETMVERRAGEAARVEVVKLQLRMETLAPLEDKLRDALSQRETYRSDCARAQKDSAVLEAKKIALEEHVDVLKGELTRARATSAKLDKKLHELSKLLAEERRLRAMAERELAITSRHCNERPIPKKTGGQQAMLWQEKS